MLKSPEKLKKYIKFIWKIFLFPLLVFVEDVSAACSIYNTQTINFSSVIVENNTKTGDIIATRSIPYTFHCDPNSVRSMLINFDNRTTRGAIAFYPRAATTQFFNGIDARITVTDHLGKQHVITNGVGSRNEIYFITDADLKSGFDWTYSVQVDLIRSEATLPTESSIRRDFFRIGQFGSSIAFNVLNTSNSGILYIAGNYRIMNNSCHITMPSSITLPQVMVSQLERANLNQTIASTPFSINLNCENELNFANIFFYDVYKTQPSSFFGLDYLTPSPNSSAKGVNLLLSHNNLPINLSSTFYSDRQSTRDPLNISFRGRAVYAQPTTNKKEVTFPLEVAYLKTSNNIEPGSLTSLVTILVNYN